MPSLIEAHYAQRTKYWVIKCQRQRMKILCAWCGKEMGEKNGRQDWVTHSVCPDFLLRLRGQRRRLILPVQPAERVLPRKLQPEIGLISQLQNCIFSISDSRKL